MAPPLINLVATRDGLPRRSGFETAQSGKISGDIPRMISNELYCFQTQETEIFDTK